jgi:hypothetical protein
MNMTIDISDDLKPDELGEIVTLSRETNKPIGQLILESARALAASVQASRCNANAQQVEVAA